MVDEFKPVHLKAHQHLVGEEIPFRVDRYQLDGSVTTYDHDFLLLVVIAKGSGTHQTIAGARSLRRGDVFVLRPGVWHMYEQCQQLVVYNCCLATQLFCHGSELGWIRQDPAIGYLFWSGPLARKQQGLVRGSLSDPQTLKICCDHLESLCQLQIETRSISKRADRLGHLLLILGLLARNMPAERHNTCKPSARFHRAVLEGVELIEQTLAEPWTLSQLARRLHVAPTYLVRLFKAHTGLPPLAYLARQRAQRAAALLLRTDRPVAQIGAEVGWPDPNYFARRFKAHLGCNATQYRKRFVVPRL